MSRNLIITLLVFIAVLLLIVAGAAGFLVWDKLSKHSTSSDSKEEAQARGTVDNFLDVRNEPTATLHAVFIADTNDKQYSQSYAIDLRRMEKEADRISRYAKLKPNFHTFDGDKLNYKNIDSAIKGLKVEKDDVVFFYCAAEGRYAGDKLPSISINGQLLSLMDVAKTLRNKAPRLLLMLVESSNDIIADNFKEKSFEPIAPRVSPESAYQYLFRKHKGFIIALAAKPGSAYAAATSGKGGHFTTGFLDGLEKELDKTSDWSWGSVIKEAMPKRPTANGLLQVPEIHSDISSIKANGDYCYQCSNDEYAQCEKQPEKLNPSCGQDKLRYCDVKDGIKYCETDKKGAVVKNGLALLIGNGNYKQVLGQSSKNIPDDFKDLKKPFRDVERMRDTLILLGFKEHNIISVRDGKKEDIELALKKFKSQLELKKNAGEYEYDFGIIYFSGHGFQDRDLNYIVPIPSPESDLSKLSDMISETDDIVNYLKDTEQTKLIILDACRTDNKERENGFASNTRDLENFVFAYSTRSRSKSFEIENDKYSVYTEKLTDNLGTKGESLRNILDRTEDEVKEKTNGIQKPTAIFPLSSNDEDLVGMICFNECRKPGDSDWLKDYGCKSGICLHNVTKQPLRILVEEKIKNIYRTSELRKKLDNELQPFSFHYVYSYSIDASNNSNRKLEIGKGVKFLNGQWQKSSDSDGWIDDRGIIIPWNQALVLSYNPPKTGRDKRNPVVMFKDEDSLTRVVDSENELNKLYANLKDYKITKRNKPSDVVATEPSCYVDVTNNPYIIPILEHKEKDYRNNKTGLLLKIMQLKPGSNMSGLQELSTPFELDSRSCSDFEHKIRKLKIDVKFVMDMTCSMSDYFDSALDNIKETVNMMTTVWTETDVKYGLIAYRDDPERDNETFQRFASLNVNTYKFGEDKLVDADEFESVLSLAITTDGKKQLSREERKKLCGGDYEESVDAGILEAIKDSSWRADTLRFIILIGDAGVREKITERITKRSMDTLRQLAKERHIYFYVIHLKDPEYKRYHRPAEDEFRKLVVNKDLYQSLNARDMDLYSTIFSVTTDRLTETVDQARKTGRVNPEPTKEEIENATGREKYKLITDLLINTALLPLLGKGQDFESIPEAWVADKDLENPDKTIPFDVSILVTRSQLNDLYSVFKRIQENIQGRKQTIEKHFLDIASASATAAEGGNQTDTQDATERTKLALVRNLRESLPYKTTVQQFNLDSFLELSTDDQFNCCIKRVDDVITLYQDKLDSNHWYKFDPNGEDAQDITFLPLSLLP